MTYGYLGYGRATGFRERCQLNHRDTKPVPPLAEYEAWFEERWANRKGRGGGRHQDPRKWRRVAILRREGYSLAEALRLAGLYQSGDAFYKQLPEHLK
jgi:hypothetical protein